MNRHPVSLPPETAIAEVVNLMLGREVHCLSVTQGGQLMGVFTSHDMLLAFASVLRRKEMQKQ